MNFEANLFYTVSIKRCYEIRKYQKESFDEYLCLNHIILKWSQLKEKSLPFVHLTVHLKGKE